MKPALDPDDERSNRSAVSGISCSSPRAPAIDTTSVRKPLSSRISE